MDATRSQAQTALTLVRVTPKVATLHWENSAQGRALGFADYQSQGWGQGRQAGSGHLGRRHTGLRGPG